MQLHPYATLPRSLQRGWQGGGGCVLGGEATFRRVAPEEPPGHFSRPAIPGYLRVFPVPRLLADPPHPATPRDSPVPRLARRRASVPHAGLRIKRRTRRGEGVHGDTEGVKPITGTPRKCRDSGGGPRHQAARSGRPRLLSGLCPWHGSAGDAGGRGNTGLPAGREPPGQRGRVGRASADWLPCLKMILLVCRSHYCTVWLLDVALDNCLWRIKWFCCLSTLFNWYFSHSCAAEKAQCCSKNQFIFPSATCVL